MNSREYLKLILDSTPTVSTAINSFNSTSEQSDSTVTQLHHMHQQQQHHDETETSENFVIKMLTTLMPSLMTDDESLSNVSLKRTNLVPSSSSIYYSGLRSDQWIAPVIALAGLNMIVIFAFEVFVLYKACRTSPSRRHLFLGQMLLLGLFLSSAVGVAFVPNPTWLSCSIIRAGLGICYSLVMGTLLVKTVFLISLHSGIYLPAEYQSLLLFFIVITQVAIDAQWLINHSSEIIIDHVDPFGSVVSRCDHSISSLLLSLVYIMFLIFIVSFLALKAKGHRENHGEALYIAITIISSIILWCIWVAGAVTSQSPKDRDAFIAFGVVGNATIVFLIMFLPKGRQLAAMGRDSGHDDRDQLSSPSSPSVYTPSFLHIKPSSFHIPLTSKNGNFYKQFGGTNGSNGHIGSGNGHPTVKSITNDRFYYIPPPPANPPPPPPPPAGHHRVWRTGCYPFYNSHNHSHHNHNHHFDEPYLFPYEQHSHSRQIYSNPNVKFFRAPCY